MVGMCAALRQIGVDATSCHFRERDVPMRPDLCLHLERLTSAERKQQREAFLKEAVQKYDVFHFHFGETFFKDRSDLEFLKKHGKKLIVQHRGSDVRMLSIANSFNNEFVRVKQGKRREEKEIINKLRELSHYIDHAIVADHELLPYVRNHYKQVHILRQFITLDRFRPAYPSKQNAKPVIVHAPTNAYLKGTEFLLQALDKLDKKGVPFEFQLVQDMPHRKAMRYYRKADIIVDQLLQGSFGVFSLEGMALGKPVVCYIRDGLKRQYPRNLPIVNANPETCYRVLHRLLTHPHMRDQIGRAGRQYIEDYYDARMLAQDLKKIYEKL